MMLKVYSSEKIRELINNKLMKSNRAQRILVVGGRGCGKTQYMKKLAEEAAKVGTIKVMRANEHYMDALRYSLTDKPKINPYYPVESEFDISRSEKISQTAMARKKQTITASDIMEAVAKLEAIAPVPPSDMLFRWATDSDAKLWSKIWDGMHLSLSTGHRFKHGEEITNGEEKHI